LLTPLHDVIVRALCVSAALGMLASVACDPVDSDGSGPSVADGGNNGDGDGDSDGDAQIAYTKVRSTLNLRGAARLIARGDFNGDGFVDVIAGDNHVCLHKTPLYLLTGLGDGTFEDGTEEMILGDTSIDAPFAVSADFNRDGKPDVAVFDAGCKEVRGNIGSYLGGPPILLLSNSSGLLEVSSNLADAVLAFNNDKIGENPQWPYSGSDLHIKYVVDIDIDNDGDVDIFVESTGGENVTSHFYISNGDGTFVIDHNNRLPIDAHTNTITEPTHFWRHQPSLFTDLNLDESPDLIMGQLRDPDPTHIDQSSIILFGDPQGYFSRDNRILLPLPDYNLAYTAVSSIAAGDLNGDGFDDLLLAHVRNDGVDESLPEVGASFTGRFIQVLINQGGSGEFTDETTMRMGDQATTAAEVMFNASREMQLYDMDDDGDDDLITAVSGHISQTSPLLYLNDGTGHFTVPDQNVFTDGDEYYGENSIPLDLNNDGKLDFIGTDVSPGEDGQYGTEDDEYNLDSLVAQSDGS
jgi:hypothetical protein